MSSKARKVYNLFSVGHRGHFNAVSSDIKMLILDIIVEPLTRGSSIEIFDESINFAQNYRLVRNSQALLPRIFGLFFVRNFFPKI